MTYCHLLVTVPINQSVLFRIQQHNQEINIE